MSRNMTASDRGKSTSPDIEDRPGEQPRRRLPASSQDGWWTQTPQRLKKTEMKEHQCETDAIFPFLKSLKRSPWSSTGYAKVNMVPNSTLFW